MSTLKPRFPSHFDIRTFFPTHKCSQFSTCYVQHRDTWPHYRFNKKRTQLNNVIYMTKTFFFPSPYPKKKIIKYVHNNIFKLYWIKSGQNNLIRNLSHSMPISAFFLSNFFFWITVFQEHNNKLVSC